MSQDLHLAYIQEIRKRTQREASETYSVGHIHASDIVVVDNLLEEVGHPNVLELGLKFLLIAQLGRGALQKQDKGRAP